MAFASLVPLLVALGAALLAWHHATRLDRQSLHDGWPAESASERRLWLVALGAVVVAAGATTLLQLTLLSRL